MISEVVQHFQMSTLFNWLGQAAFLIAVFLVIGIPFWVYWVYDSRTRKKKFAAAFEGRDPLDEQMFYERYFQSRGAPADVVMKVRRILERVLRADLSRLKAEDDFTQNLSFFFQFDSMADVEIVVELEKEFGIKIADIEAEQTHTIEDIVELVWRKLDERGALTSVH